LKSGHLLGHTSTVWAFRTTFIVHLPRPSTRGVPTPAPAVGRGLAITGPPAASPRGGKSVTAGDGRDVAPLAPGVTEKTARHASTSSSYATHAPAASSPAHGCRGVATHAAAGDGARAGGGGCRRRRRRHRLGHDLDNDGSGGAERQVGDGDGRARHCARMSLPVGREALAWERLERGSGVAEHAALLAFRIKQGDF